MKHRAVLAVSVFWIGFSLAASLAVAANTSAYVVERSIASGRKVDNFPIHTLSDLNRTQLFGMSKEVDEAIASLDYRKSYKCDINGTYSHFGVSSGFQVTGGLSLFKVYSLSNCVEVTRSEVLRIEKQRDEDRVPQ